MSTRRPNAYETWRDSGTWAVFTHSSAGYDSMTAVKDGRKYTAHWVLLPPHGKKLKLAEGERCHPGSFADGKPFTTLADAVAYARRAGVVGWTYQRGQYQQFWLADPNGDPEPQACEETVNTSGSSRWSSFRPCGRPVSDGDTVCKTHAGQRDRARAKEEAWRAEHDAERANDQASTDWARRLREEFGVKAEPSRHRMKRLRVQVEPESLYGLLVELAGVLRDVDVPWPEQPGVDNERKS